MLYVYTLTLQSEYSESHALARLIGSPPGYVGHDEGGQLTEAVRRRPYSVVLFDEMEKAHPDVFNLLLQVLDDGRLTDAKGTLVNFRNCILIFTSNVGSSYRPSNATNKEAVDVARKQYIMQRMKEQFKPEFLNRIDDFVVFKPLEISQLLPIVDLEMKRLSERLQENGKQLKVELSASARLWLAREGFDPEYGARPLKRVIQREVENNLAKGILQGNYSKGVIISIDVQLPENKLVFKSK